MTIENSELNKSGPLKSSNSSFDGASGTGNDPPQADLAQGFSHLPDPEKVPHWLPQNADDGENYVGEIFGERGGFAGRPRGNER
jgi:hypothetical protein